jgi:hypothetical protein
VNRLERVVEALLAPDDARTDDARKAG